MKTQANKDSQKIIVVLDYSSGDVRTVPFSRNPERAFHKWCDNNNVNTSNCEWMATTSAKIHSGSELHSNQ